MNSPVRFRTGEPVIGSASCLGSRLFRLARLLAQPEVHQCFRRDPLTACCNAHLLQQIFGDRTVDFARGDIDGNVDADPTDPFDFFPTRYNAQLVAGYSKNTPAKGLKTYMPDFADLQKPGR